MSPAPFRRPIRIVGDSSELIDPAIARDVQWIRANWPVDITDGYAPTGHDVNGEHPLGLAIDIVPDTSRGGTWKDVADLVAWAEPRPEDPRRPFRWVGYNGDHGHGDPQHAGTNAHAHLSWKHDSQGRVDSIFDASGEVRPGITLPRGKSAVGGQVNASGGDGGGINLPSTAQQVAGAIPGAGPTLGPLAGIADATGVDDVAGGLATDIAGSVANKLVQAFAAAIGKDGVRMLLYVGLTTAGAALAVVGLARAAGVKAPTNLAGLATLAATRNPKAAAAVGAAT